MALNISSYHPSDMRQREATGIPRNMTVRSADTPALMVRPKDCEEWGEIGADKRDVWPHYQAEGTLSGADPLPSHFADEKIETKEPTLGP